MNVKKISDTQLQITLTEEELYFEYELELDDLVDSNKRDEVSKKLINIINSVSEEHNMKISQGIDIKAKVDSMNNLTLDVEYIPNFNLNNLQGIAKYVKSNSSDKTIKEQEEYYEKLFKAMGMTDEDIEEIYEQLEKIKENIDEYNIEEYTYEELFYLLECNSLDDCITLSKLFKNIITNSSLYKHKQKYYLALEIVPETDETIINISSEFLCKRKDDLYLYFLKEHGQIIITDDAINKLASL